MVYFSSDIIRFSEPSLGASLSVLGGSFKRFESTASVFGGAEFGSLEISGGHHESGDYKHGGGKKMHKHYKHKDLSLVGTLTPLEGTAVQFSADFGDGKAAYADRGMDGTKFDRKSFGVKFEQELGDHRAEFGAYSHKIDHVMDNFTMRPVKKPNGYSLGNPMRDMAGAKGEVELNLGDLTSYIAAGFSKDTHKGRGAKGVTKEQAQAAKSQSAKRCAKSPTNRYTRKMNSSNRVNSGSLAG